MNSLINFIDKSVANPYNWNLKNSNIPTTITTLAGLIEWLNEGKLTADLKPNFGAVYAAGTVNNAANLNGAQKNGIFSTSGTRTSATSYEYYILDVDNLDTFWGNAYGGSFDIQLLMTPNETNLMAAPKVRISGADYPIRYNGSNLDIGELTAGMPYLLVFDADNSVFNLQVVGGVNLSQLSRKNISTYSQVVSASSDSSKYAMFRIADFFADPDNIYIKGIVASLDYSVAIDTSNVGFLDLAIKGTTAREIIYKYIGVEHIESTIRAYCENNDLILLFLKNNANSGVKYSLEINSSKEYNITTTDQVSDLSSYTAIETLTNSYTSWLNSSKENIFSIDIYNKKILGSAIAGTLATQTSPGFMSAADKKRLDDVETPAGTILFFSSSSLPSGYLKANGAAISRTTYSKLFSVIGTTFGAGDGSTTFNLPDLRGEFLRGWDDGRGVDNGRVLGSTQNDEIKSHDHPRNTENLQEQTNVYPTAGSGIISGAYTAGNQLRQYRVTGSTGGAETRPRNIALMAIIKY